MHQHIDTRVNYVSPEICEFIANDVPVETLYQQGIMNIENGIPTGEFTVNTDSRYVLCGTKFNNPKAINSVIQQIVTNFIEPKYLCNVKSWEWPQLLVYPEDGGHYKPHVDGEMWYEDGGWKKVTNRDITMLLYLDDNYEGGELIFPDYNITIRPKQGQLITFPSNRYFKHGVLPLTRGMRRVLVCWMTVWGEIGVSEQHNVVLNGEYK